MSFTDQSDSLLDEVLRLENLLVSFSTGGGGDNVEYEELRGNLVHNPAVRGKLRAFVRQCRNLSQFWAMVKKDYGTYQERRDLLWASFRPLIDELEFLGRSGATIPIRDALEAFDPDRVHVIWEKANARTTSDPEGAITAARTLIETVCKYILDDLNVPYPDDADLPKLWAIAAEALKLAPQQHEEQAFKAILGNVQSVVNYSCRGCGARRKCRDRLASGNASWRGFPACSLCRLSGAKKTSPSGSVLGFHSDPAGNRKLAKDRSIGTGLKNAGKIGVLEDSAIAAERFAARTWGNSAAMSGFVSHPETLSSGTRS